MSKGISHSTRARRILFNSLKMASLQGKVIAITGAASGIGLALAHLAGSRGARLAIADIQESQLEKVIVASYCDNIHRVDNFSRLLKN
jgi:NADPH:quinone reductase-like Zn-dependent oxidoreductase